MAFSQTNEVSPEHRLAIQAIANELAPEQVARGMECPFCHSDEKAFVVTRKQLSALYICHRAGCSRKGRVTVGASDKPIGGSFYRRASGSNKLAEAINRLEPLPLSVVKFMFERYNLPPGKLNSYGVMWSPSLERVFFSIRNQYGNEVGGVLRRLAPGTGPKTLTVMTVPEASPIAFYGAPSQSKGKVQLVVEDQLSAMRAAALVPTTALLGTNLNVVGMNAIRKLQPRKLVICLDADAFNKGLELQKRWRDCFEECVVVKPPCDLKDMTEDDLEQFIGEHVLGEEYANA